MTDDSPALGALMTLANREIGQDENGNICLNDLWAVAGSPPNGRPAEWRRNTRTAALEAALIEQIVGNTHNLEPIVYAAGPAGPMRSRRASV